MNTLVTRSSFVRSDGTQFSSMMLVVVAHVAVIYLLTLSPAREAISNASALMVTLIREQPRAERRPAVLPKPLPVKLPQIAVGPVPPVAINSAPADISTEPSAKETSAPAVVVARAAPATVAPPRFDADYLDNPAPVYPTLSKRMGEEGKVLLRVHVDANGNAIAVDIRASSGSQRLDNAAIDAVRRWKFVPARQDDKSVDAWVLVPIDFSLRNAG